MDKSAKLHEFKIPKSVHLDLQVQPPKLTLLELMVVLNVLCAAELLIFTLLRRAYASLRRLCGAAAPPISASDSEASSRARVREPTRRISSSTSSTRL